MSNVTALADFRKRDRVHTLQALDELRARVDSGEIEALFIVAFDNDMGSAETWLLNLCALDVVETMGALEIAKMQLLRASE